MDVEEYLTTAFTTAFPTDFPRMVTCVVWIFFSLICSFPDLIDHETARVVFNILRTFDLPTRTFIEVLLSDGVAASEGITETGADRTSAVEILLHFWKSVNVLSRQNCKHF